VRPGAEFEIQQSDQIPIRFDEHNFVLEFNADIGQLMSKM
jgi:hypothetical protein